MQPVDFILVALLLPLTAASAFFSATETALFSMRQPDRIRLRKTSPASAAAVSVLLARPRDLLATLLVGNTLANGSYFAVASVLATHAHGVWAGLVGAGCVLWLILVAEIIPKTLAVAHRVLYCRLLATTIAAIYRLAKPVRVVVGGLIVTPLTRLIRPAGAGERAPSSVEELSSLLSLVAREGVIAGDEQRMLADVVSLHTLRVRDAMTPRVDMRWLLPSSSVLDLLGLCRESEHTKFPVRESEDLPPLGLVNAQRLFPLLNQDAARFRRAAISRWVEPARYIPDRARLDQLLDHFRASHSDVALCVDELGAVTGIVRMEDVVARLVSGLSDAGADPDEQIRMTGIATWEVPGRLNIHDWAEYFDLKLPALRDAPVTTVGGLLMWRLGRLPRAGDEIRLGGVVLRVQSTDGRTVGRAVVTIPQAAPRGARA